MSSDFRAIEMGDSNDAESLISSFHRVESLIPEGQELLTIPPEKPVIEALKIMQENHYSQVPVVAGDAVLGVFSFRSFSNRALARQKTSKAWLGNLPVEDFLEEFEYAHPTEDWNRVLRYLDQDDAFLVGHQDSLGGLITTMDMLNYFQNIANPFIMLAEIELSLRKIIQTCVEGTDLPEFFRISLNSIYEKGKEPIILQEMTFNDYIVIITSKGNWPYFETFFGDHEGVRGQTNQKLEQLRQWRNTVFHFRKRLEQWELDKLAEYREWLQRRVRAYVSIQKKQPRSPSSIQTTSSRTTMTEFRSQCTKVSIQFFNQVFQASERKGHSVEAGKTGYVVKAHLPGEPRPIGFIYMFPADQFKFRFQKLPFTDEERQTIRQELLKTGNFRREGDRGVKATVTEDNAEQLQKILDWIFLKVEALTRND